MIVYLATKAEFIADVLTSRINEKISAEYRKHTECGVSDREEMSWKNSMPFMSLVLGDAAIPNDAGIAIEFIIPRTLKRIDLTISGFDENDRKVAVIIELKQWSEVEATEKDGVVRTILNGAYRERPHPSYQAWSYAALLEDFNEAVTAEPIALRPCSYLHNCDNTTVLFNDFYREHTLKAPTFLRDDATKLREFICRHVRKGDGGHTMYVIEAGKIRPSKNLADSLKSLLNGNREFLMIDDQKVVFETGLHLSHHSTNLNKNVLIVEGGPGTGKSVVAVNLLVALTARQKVVQYVTKNAAPRAVYESKLTGTLNRTRFTNLFTGSGSFIGTPPNTFDALVVDEAHRLTAKSGMLSNKGENQIKELINASRLSVFFIDEDQRVTFKDIGRKAEIEKWAKAAGATITSLELQSQFRCNGADGYLAWVDSVLQIRETANRTLDGVAYDFRVCESPKQLHDLVIEHNRETNKARTVAGYCWDWISKDDRHAMDIQIPEHGFHARWNLADDGNLWILKPESVREVGCIHTCQGLEVDYIGVIIGADLIVRDGRVQTRPEKRSRMDSSVKGYKKLLEKSPYEAKAKAEFIIKNTYRTLMTRGQKGCFVWAIDAETNNYLKDRMRR